jgi:hypothetical protein
MLDFLKTFVDTLGSLLTFIFNYISSLFNLISKLPAFVLFLTNSVALMPMILIPFVLAAISIYLVLFILGRN